MTADPLGALVSGVLFAALLWGGVFGFGDLGGLVGRARRWRVSI